jgi:hypothetical protein
MTVTDKFWFFFKPIAESAPGVVYTQMSDADRVDRWMADSRSEDTYPGVFVLRPKYTGSNDAVMTAYFDVVFYVFVRGDLDDYAMQDDAYQIAELIVQYIGKEVNHKSHEGECFFDFNSFKPEPVAYQMIDSAWGYEVRMKIGLLVNDIFC